MNWVYFVTLRVCGAGLPRPQRRIAAQNILGEALFCKEIATNRWVYSIKEDGNVVVKLMVVQSVLHYRELIGYN